MIGFVDVKVSMIKRAYQHLENDVDIAEVAINSNKKFSNRVRDMSEIMNTSKGKNNSYFKKTDKVRLKRLLEEVAYASYATDSDSMFIRIEMASIILDIIKIYEDIQRDK